ncbi:MAG: hypothetical protein HY747_12130 [Elusimicrobia bacterium]|nr:hypothetical protein [Elusimicrobiota bacterium]
MIKKIFLTKRLSQVNLEAGAGRTMSKKTNAVVVIFLTTLHASLLTLPAQAKAPLMSLEDKIALENSLETKLKSVLIDILGTDKIITAVNVELKTAEEGEESFVLPGVPARDKMTGEGILSLGDAAARIKRLTATIVLDKSTKAADVELAKKVASGILGISPERGDRLNVDTMAFRKAAQVSFNWKQLFVPPDLWKLCGIILFVVFIFWTLPKVALPLAAGLREMADKLQAALQASREGAAEEGSEGIRERGNEGSREEEAAGATATDGEKPPFYFLNPAHAPALNFLLAKERAEVIAVVLHYAPPALASAVMEKLDDAGRAEVLERLAVTREENPDTVRKIEADLQSKIQYLVGGETKIGRLLEETDIELQNQLLSSLEEKNPEIAGRLKKQLVFIEDIERLERPGLQLLIRRVPAAVLARILKVSFADKTADILAKLPEGAAERLRQEIEVTGETQKGQLNADKRRVIDALRALQREGYLEKNEKGFSPGELPLPLDPGTSPDGSPVLLDGTPSATGFKGSSPDLNPEAAPNEGPGSAPEEEKEAKEA